VHSALTFLRKSDTRAGARRFARLRLAAVRGVPMQVFLTIIVFCIALVVADLLFGDGQITQRVVEAAMDLFH